MTPPVLPPVAPEDIELIPADDPDTAKPCTLCSCWSLVRVFGFRVCGYHAAHGEDDPPCPVCEVRP